MKRHVTITWSPPPELVLTEVSRIVNISPDVYVEDMLWLLFKVAEWRVNEWKRENINLWSLYKCWQIAYAREEAYWAMSDGEIVWH